MPAGSGRERVPAPGSGGGDNGVSRRRPIIPAIPGPPGSRELLLGQAPAQPRAVSGVRGGSALLSVALPPGASVRAVEWSFTARDGGGGAAIQVAELGPGGLERPDPGDRFARRLDILDGPALRIRRLEPGDSGVYGARVKLRPALVLDQAFELSVYEAVPSPRSRRRLLARTLLWCNVTLQCQGAGGGAVNVTWHAGDGGGVAQQQVSRDGTTLRLALPPAAANGTYPCTVSNPADRKVVVFDLREICEGAGGAVSFSTSGYVVLTLLLLAGSLGGAFWCWRRSGGKAAEPAATPTAPAAESPCDPQYAEIVRRSPPEGKDQGLRPPENHAEPKAPAGTVPEQLGRAPESAPQEVT
ncbi:SLAM family member 8-like [Eudromia elegans]